MGKFKLHVRYTTLKGKKKCEDHEFNEIGGFFYSLFYKNKQITHLDLKMVSCDQDVRFVFTLNGNHLKKIFIHKNTSIIECDNIKLYGSKDKKEFSPFFTSDITFYC